jgi:hypothetical protein
MLAEGAATIERLRRSNEVLEAQMAIVNLFGAVFFAKVERPGVAMSPDVAWAMKKMVETLNAEAAKAAEEKASNQVAEEARPPAARPRPTATNPDDQF